MSLIWNAWNMTMRLRHWVASQRSEAFFQSKKKHLCDRKLFHKFSIRKANNLVLPLESDGSFSSYVQCSRQNASKENRKERSKMGPRRNLEQRRSSDSWPRTAVTALRPRPAAVSASSSGLRQHGQDHHSSGLQRPNNGRFSKAASKTMATGWCRWGRCGRSTRSRCGTKRRHYRSHRLQEQLQQ